MEKNDSDLFRIIGPFAVALVIAGVIYFTVIHESPSGLFDEPPPPPPEPTATAPNEEPMTPVPSPPPLPTPGPVTSGSLIFWNTLDSPMEFLNSRIGPGMPMEGNVYFDLNGKIGGALKLDETMRMTVSIPGSAIPRERGCIEFWAKLEGHTGTIPSGESPGFIRQMIGKGRTRVGLHFNSNDGRHGSGLCGWAGDGFTAATAKWPKRHSYEQILGKDTVGDWHHYALSWDEKGVPGLKGATNVIAIFLDGELNSAWYEKHDDSAFIDFGDTPAQLLSGRLKKGGLLLMDQIKIWNYAKTDFSDNIE